MRLAPIVIDRVKAKTVQSAPDDGVPLGGAETPTDRAMELGPSEAHGTNGGQGALTHPRPPLLAAKKRCLVSHEIARGSRHAVAISIEAVPLSALLLSPSRLCPAVPLLPFSLQAMIG